MPYHPATNGSMILQATFGIATCKAALCFAWPRPWPFCLFLVCPCFFDIGGSWKTEDDCCEKGRWSIAFFEIVCLNIFGLRICGTCKWNGWIFQFPPDLWMISFPGCQWPSLVNITSHTYLGQLQCQSCVCYPWSWTTRTRFQAMRRHTNTPVFQPTDPHTVPSHMPLSKGCNPLRTKDWNSWKRRRPSRSWSLSLAWSLNLDSTMFV